MANLKGSNLEKVLSEEASGTKRRKKSSDQWLGCPNAGSGGHMHHDKHTWKKIAKQMRASANFTKYSRKQPDTTQEAVNHALAREMSKKPASHGGLD